MKLLIKPTTLKVGKQLNQMMKLIQKAEDSVPVEYWIEVDDATRQEFDSMFQKVRIRLRDEEKVYDPSSLKLMRRLRCKDDGGRAECTEKLE